jgi:chromosome partitioning protein
VRISEAPSFGRPVVLVDVKSRGAQAYLSLAREMLDVERVAS